MGEIPLVQEKTIAKQEVNKDEMEPRKQFNKKVNIIGGALFGFFTLPLYF